MKSFFSHLLLLSSLLISSHSIAQGSLAALDAKNGFSDAKFGVPPSTIKGLKLKDLEFDNKIAIYERTPFMIGDIQLSLVRYTFIFNKLVSIEVESVAPNCQELITTMRLAYGQPIRGEYYHYKWTGKKVTMFCNRIDSEKVYCRFESNDYGKFHTQARLSYLAAAAAKYRNSDPVKKRLKDL